MGFFNGVFFFDVGFFGPNPHGSRPSHVDWAKLTHLIFMLPLFDQVIFDLRIIKDFVLSFYTNLYVILIDLMVFVTNMKSFVASYIPSLVIDYVFFFIKCPYLDEVKHAVFSFSGDSAHGPNGLGGCFITLFGTLWVSMFVKLSHNSFVRRLKRFLS